MDDAELLSILEDSDAGLSPTDGYGPAREHAVALIAERDRLRTAVDELTEVTTRDLHVLHRISTAVGQRDDLSAAVHAMVVERNDLANKVTVYAEEIQRLRAVARGAWVGIETVLVGDHVDMKLTAGEVLGRISATLKETGGVERDRLRNEVESLNGVIAGFQAGAESALTAALLRAGAAEAERDRLWAVVKRYQLANSACDAALGDENEFEAMADALTEHRDALEALLTFDVGA